MMLLKVSTARNLAFKMIDSADHVSKKTGLSPTVNISKNGGSFSAAAGTVTEIANGWYLIALTTADVDTLGDLAFYITATGADDSDFVRQVVTELPGETAGLVTALLQAVLDDYEDVGEIRTVVAALSRLLNRTAPSGAYLETYMSDGVTAWFKQAVTTDTSLDPIGEIGGNVAP